MKSKGFTLAEVIIAMAIMAILAAIAAPNYRTYMANQRLKGAARQVMSDLMNARMMAVSKNQRVKVHFSINNATSPDNHTYRIWNDANNDGTVADNEGDNILRDIHPDYYDVTFSGTPDNPVFDPRGTASTGSIIVTSSRGSKYICISSAGRVRISNAACS
ncbi:MAG: GspH/FimT family protein [Deltaproteobacteria bacterium]|nr:GspH/FimT family protein [Deltaproteobacteria bacterium]